MILFGCTDVGPAKYIALIAKHFSNSYIFSSELNKHIFNNLDLIEIKDLEKLKNIDLIFIGTSISEKSLDIEKKILAWGKRNKVPTISFIEHWYYYKKRFEGKDGINYPDYIIVNDDIAKRGAITEGLPSEKIYVLGNPYLESLAYIDKKLSAKKDILKKYNLPLNKKVICFISEDIKNTKNSELDSIGYDEYEVLDTIVDNFLDDSSFLIIKKHPAEKKEKYIEYKSANIHIIENCELDHLASMSDHSIGMHSMLLIELSFFRNDIISFRPNFKKEFIGALLEVVVAVKNLSELRNALQHNLIAQNKIDDSLNFLRRE